MRKESENGLYALLKLYVERFGDKACCFEDLKPYIALQDADELRKVTDFLDSLSLEAVRPLPYLPHCLSDFWLTTITTSAFH